MQRLGLVASADGKLDVALLIDSDAQWQRRPQMKRGERVPSPQLVVVAIMFHGIRKTMRETKRKTGLTRAFRAAGLGYGAPLRLGYFMQGIRH